MIPALFVDLTASYDLIQKFNGFLHQEDSAQAHRALDVVELQRTRDARLHHF